MTSTESPPRRSGGLRDATPEDRPSASTAQTEDLRTVPVRSDVLQAAARLVFEDSARQVVGRSEAYLLGWHAGWDHGYRDAERDMADAWAESVRRVRALADRPRGDPTCARHCGRCSVCVRDAAVARNLRLYGSPDLPPLAGPSRPPRRSP